MLVRQYFLATIEGKKPMEALPIEDHRKNMGESQEKSTEELITIPIKDDPAWIIHVGSQWTTDYRDRLMIFQRASKDIFI